ncbi:putative porin [Luteirhabdus pelagi]|uniref:putative porin n=1 Tax=Luteirhabdus pelagi TaxID=2792783 RepID=UPI00193AD35A|nr:putative porin [Luteirhabdus pelagi]
MNTHFLRLLLLLLPFSMLSQTLPLGNNQSDTSPNPPMEKPPIEYYKIISYDRDTTFVDTSLSIQKEYKFNYLRRDHFELLPFSNVGQAYNTLVYNFEDTNLLPKFVAQSHHFNYMDTEDISYYNVPTPLTELYFKTAFEQGQQLDAFFTVNTSPQFNFSVAYKGVRSLGIYQSILTSTGNFRFTANYHTKDNRYKIRTHFTAQDILNEENGGLAPTSIPLFVNDDPEFEDRGRLDVNFEDAENKIEGQRYYMDHEYELISQRDSVAHSILAIGNRLKFEDRYYRYSQDTPFEGFGPSYENENLRTRTTLEEFNAQAYARWDHHLFGRIDASLGYTNLNYGYNSILILDEGRISNRIQADVVQFTAGYQKRYRGFELSGRGGINLSGDLAGNFLEGSASFDFTDDLGVKASTRIHSAAPNYNFLLYQNDYENYNWQTSFDNVKTQELAFELYSEKWGKAKVSYTGIDDYAYFAVPEVGLTPAPQQASERINYLKVKAEKTFRYGVFALANTIAFQQEVGGEDIFNVPQIVTRQSLFYEDHWFKKALFLQTGINFKWFSEYNMNAYDPVLAEFYVQNDQKLGGFPLFDIFFNAKVRQTRIYLKYEHVNQLFSSRNEYFSAPGYPYRDAIIRFGLVWNFFL